MTKYNFNNDIMRVVNKEKLTNKIYTTIENLDDDLINVFQQKDWGVTWGEFYDLVEDAFNESIANWKAEGMVMDMEEGKK